MAKKKPVKEPRKVETSTAVVEKSRDALLEAAKHLFANKGYDGTTVKDISERAGVNISLVSYHFQGKEGLYRACIEQFGNRRLQIAERILEVPTSLEECKIRLRMFIEEIVNWYNDEPELNRIIQREIDSCLPIAEDVFRNTILKVFVTCESFIKGAQSNSVVRTDADAHIITAIIFGSLQFKMRTSQLGERFFGHSFKDAKQTKHLIDQYMQTIFEGLEVKSQTRGTQK